MTGKIIKGIAGFYVVESGGQTYMCKARGIFRKDGRKPLVGDLVRFSEAETADSEANIEELLPRTSELIRPAVCNVDQTLVVLAVRTPDPQLLLLDEYLVTMERQNVPAAILFNKADLDRDGILDRLKRIYGAAGFRVLTSSARTGEGIEELREFLKGKTTVLAGPSGVGKSSLTNLICPQAGMETGEISRKIARGKQTTRHTELFPLGENTYLLDTPGFTSVYVDAEQDELRLLFPEIAALEGKCRFTGCRHLAEPDCAVKNAVTPAEKLPEYGCSAAAGGPEDAEKPEDSGKAGTPGVPCGMIPASRYESYKKLMKELSERRKYG